MVFRTLCKRTTSRKNKCVTKAASSVFLHMIKCVILKNLSTITSIEVNFYTSELLYITHSSHMYLLQILLAIKVLQGLMITVNHELLLNQVIFLCLQCHKDNIKCLVINRPLLSCFI